MFRNSNYERKEADLYETPSWCVEALLSNYNIPGPILEPACGKGAISNALSDKGYLVYSYDLNNYKEDFSSGNFGFDFINNEYAKKLNFKTIITNPPYANLAEKFVVQALKDIEDKPTGMVCMLLRNEFDCSVKRTYLFDRHPFSAKLVLTRRPKWVEDNKASPMHNYAWYIWDNSEALNLGGKLLYGR